MSGTIEYMMAHPEIVEQLPKEGLEMLLALVRAEKMKLAGCMPQSAITAMTDIVDDKMMQDIVNDLRTLPQRSGFLPPAGGPPQQGMKSWPKLQPLSSPPGVAICDRIADHFAELDKIEAEKRWRRI